MWWTWCIAGLVFLALEMVQPGGLFLLFFGVGAICTGLIIGMSGELQSWVPWALFSFLSIAFLILFRAKLREYLTRNSMVRGPELSGEIGQVVEKGIEAGATGIVELRGTQWQARNKSNQELPLGSRVRVAGVTGLTLEVMPEH